MLYDDHCAQIAPTGSTDGLTLVVSNCCKIALISNFVHFMMIDVAHHRGFIAIVGMPSYKQLVALRAVIVTQPINFM